MNLYEILNINPDASCDDIKKSYKNLAKKYHPDKNKTIDTTNKFKDINMAYEVLSDIKKKTEYDAMSKVEQCAFYDVLKNLLTKINPNGIHVINDVINFFYDDENTLKSELNEFNFSNVLSRVQTKLENSTLIDISNFLKSINDTNSDIKLEDNANTSCIDYDIDPNIELTINTSLKDSYTNKFKKITYKTNNENDTVCVPLYNNEIIFLNKGNYRKDNTRGNLHITVNIYDHDVVKIINDNDLVVFFKISLYEYLYGINFKYNLFGDEININIPSCVDIVPIIKVDGKGLPYKKLELDDEYVEMNYKNDIIRGDFYVYLQIENMSENESQIKDNFPPLNRDDQ